MKKIIEALLYDRKEIFVVRFSFYDFQNDYLTLQVLKFQEWDLTYLASFDQAY